MQIQLPFLLLMMPLIADSTAFLLLMMPLIADSAAFLLLILLLVANSAASLLLILPLFADSDASLLLILPLIAHSIALLQLMPHLVSDSSVASDCKVRALLAAVIKSHGGAGRSSRSAGFNNIHTIIRVRGVTRTAYVFHVRMCGGVNHSQKLLLLLSRCLVVVSLSRRRAPPRAIRCKIGRNRGDTLMAFPIRTARRGDPPARDDEIAVTH